ncbi:AEC family transporter [Breoghania sp. L-A4]|uniref:AEC family transporter n=1 Tax=Breoghania sp. L-A4 TaxID=2304600 RepID=UPI000E358E9C|nr:AEC family transporter [Breoghania sp. L-A4]AXS41077.1 AEC family transporter [Breoghania sp. L-A4]
MDDAVFGNFASASLPVLVLIVTGLAARRLLIRDQAAWAALDRINFRLLIPALIIGTLAGNDIHAVSSLRIMSVIALALLGLTASLLLLYRLLVPARMDAPAFTSLFQTSTRWNASIALVVAGLIYDPQAITIIALIMVILMPLVNVINISVMVRVLDARGSAMTTLISVARNPIILGCLAGIGLSAARVPLPQPLADSLALLGHASIATILLSLGAGLSLSGFHGRTGPIALSCALKLLVMPGLVLLIGRLAGLDTAVLTVATVATAMPTATNGYVVAQEMGGDAQLYASSCTVQMLLSLATVPLWILFCLRL